MVRTTPESYEVSSESHRERMIAVPYARQTDITPTLHDPAQVTGLVAGATLTGTIITLDAVTNVAIINVADGAVFWHNVRNVLTYNAGVENTWGAINVGDPVYYDPSNTMPATTKLSTSPLDRTGAVNTLFGHVTLGSGEHAEVAAAYPKGAGGVASTQECAIMQV